MIFKIGQIISLGILGGAGGYLIYKAKPSTRRIEAEYYERLEEEKKLQKENELKNGIHNTTSTEPTLQNQNLDNSNNTNSVEENPSSSSSNSGGVMGTIKSRTQQLKTKIQEKAPKRNITNSSSSESVDTEERNIQRNRLYSKFYENYRNSNEVMFRGKENAGLRRRYEDIKRIHDY